MGQIKNIKLHIVTDIKIQPYMGARNSKVKPKDLKELHHHTAFTKKELRAWYDSFAQDFPSGYLTVDQFKLLYANFFPTGDVDAFAEHAFRTFDLNDDGALDFREFMTSLSITTRGTTEEKLKWVFSMYDADADGFVTKEEMLVIVRAVYSMIGEQVHELPEDEATPALRVDKIYGRMDKNMDDKLSFNEFVAEAKLDPTLNHLLQTNI